MSITQLFVAILWVSVVGEAVVNWNRCEITEPDFHRAPWTVTIRRQSLRDVVHFPGTVLNEGTLLTSLIRYVMVAGTDGWRMCTGENYTVLDEHGNELSIVKQLSPYPDLLSTNGDTETDHRTNTSNEEHNLVLIHLERPLEFSERLRPVCLPGTGDEIRHLINDSGWGMLSGWNTQTTLPPAVITMSIEFRSDEECKQLWGLMTTQDPFTDRVCGSSVSVPTGSPINGQRQCINWGSGMMVKTPDHAGERRAILIGFSNNLFRNREVRLCDQDAVQYISIFNDGVLNWIRRGINCGSSSQFACRDGRCLPVQKMCDGESNCSGGEDEYDGICKPRDCCNPDTEFACGDDGPCLSYKNGAARCNGVVDCPNGEDEDTELCAGHGGSREWDTWKVILIAMVSFILLGGLVGGIMYTVHRRRRMRLANEHIDAFLNGSGSILEAEPKTDLLDIRRLKYDTSYECNEADCVLGSHLGNGRFGTVCLASLNGKTVAVKTRNPVGEDVACFIALLAELKMMLYIDKEGGHENIVRLVGANTSNIRARKLQVAIEYCPNGSLETFLQTQRHRFSSTSFRSLDQFTNFIGAEKEVQNFTSVELVKWSMQVSQGIQFLAEKRIVHSDLATRNVLLDEGYNAKICDFGLSHQFFSSSNAYTTTTRLDFPWRWAAPEALETMGRVYNLKSDVWSFGILLWEVFSLGQLPWLQIEDPDHLLTIIHEEPFRGLEKPKHCPDDRVYEIMHSCWKLNPEQRPDFEKLTRQFQHIFDKMCCTIQENCTPSAVAADVDGWTKFKEHCNDKRDKLDVQVDPQSLSLSMHISISPSTDDLLRERAYLPLDTCFAMS